jgi:predicted HicB family RNase H-like nuclease
MTAHTPLRSIRVPDATWQAAQVKAKERGESVSDVVRRALERYVKR